MDNLDTDFSCMTRDEIIEYYFHQGLMHKEIAAILLSVHAITASVRIVKRVLKNRDCFRRQPTSRETYLRAVQFTEHQLQESGQCLGYRALWKRMQMNDIFISQKKALQILRYLDKEGVVMRKRRRLHRRNYINPGPNFSWHMDGYDKLKPFGFPIHGCIDGYSRRILWLEVGSTNNNPVLIAQYYVQTAVKLGCIPCVIRADRGNENGQVKKIQNYFRSLHNDCLSGDDSFQYGKSTGNQRIESFWGQLRKQCIQFWMNKFKDFVTAGTLDMSSRPEALSLRFCFLHLIRRDLNRMASEWNLHRIQVKKGVETQAGKPELMYFSPQFYDTVDYRKEFDHSDMNVVLDTLENIKDFDDHSPDYIRFITALKGNITLPSTFEHATDMFLDIVQSIRNVRTYT